MPIMTGVKGVLIPLGLGATLLLVDSIAPDLLQFVPDRALAWTIFVTMLWGAIGLTRAGATIWVAAIVAAAVIVNPFAPLGWPSASWETWADRAAGALAACAVIRLWK